MRVGADAPHQPGTARSPTLRRDHRRCDEDAAAAATLVRVPVTGRIGEPFVAEHAAEEVPHGFILGVIVIPPRPFPFKILPIFREIADAPDT